MGTSSVTKKLRVGGMTCTNCQSRIEKKLLRTIGIEGAEVSYSDGTAVITYDTNVISLKGIIGIINELGYSARSGESGFNCERAVGIVIVVAALYTLLQRFGLGQLFSSFPLAEEGMGYGTLFVIGLLTSVHCIGMCGGINLSQCVTKPGINGGTFAPSFLYNAGRVISYTVIGGIVGAIGGAISFSGAFSGAVQIIAGVFMIIMGVNMLGLFPHLSRFAPRMPEFLARRITSAKIKGKAPLYVGLLNGLMPCGPLQAMQLYALSTGSPVSGALSMLAFSLGTAPLMFGLGALSSILSGKFTRRAMTAGAILVIVLGMSMFTQGWSLSGFSLVPSGTGAAVASPTEGIKIENGVQIVNSTLSYSGYPRITVQAGTPVRWTIDAPKGSLNGCNYRMVVPEYNIAHQFNEGRNVIEFTPTKTGKFTYTCWMGMIRGTITVVKAGEKTAAAGAAEAAERPDEFAGAGAHSCCQTRR